MLGAARYVSSHNNGTGFIGEPGRERKPPDYLAPIAWKIALRDFFPNCLFPWATHNRGDALEDAWVEDDRGISQTFGDIKDKEEQGLIPSIVFSPMLVEDGRRLLISNLQLHDLAVIQGEALLGDDVDALRNQYKNETIPPRETPSIPTLTTWSTQTSPRSRLSSSSGYSASPAEKSSGSRRAVRMSATFPYVTSSVTLPTDPPRHVVDAGYYDNYGVNLAAAWIVSHRVWIKKHAAGVMVIQIRAFRNEKRLKVLSEEIQPSTSNARTPKHRGAFTRQRRSVLSLAHFAGGRRSSVGGAPGRGLSKGARLVHVFPQ